MKRSILDTDIFSEVIKGRNAAVAATAKNYRAAIGRADPMIAGIALHHGLVLVTANTNHFQRISDLGYPLQLENWREAPSST